MSCSLCSGQFIKRPSTKLSKCNHSFHTKCLIKWVNTNEDPSVTDCCPICMENMSSEELAKVCKPMIDQLTKEFFRLPFESRKAIITDLEANIRQHFENINSS